MSKSKDLGPDEIIKRAQAGEESAVSELLEKYRPMIAHAVGVYYPLLQGEGYSEEDLEQEASIALASAVRGFDPERGFTFGAYARRCVRNRMISALRRASGKRHTGAGAADTSAEGERAIDPESVLSLERQLTVYERTVFRLMTQGYKPAEISARVARDVKSVYNAICRIKAKAAVLKEEK